MFKLVLGCALLVGAVACSNGAECSQEVVETDSGLKYEDIECGDGAEAARGDTVSVHYTGTLEDGEEFDSSEGKEPLTVRLGAGQVIAGFEEGLTGMRVGGVRELTIPPDLGYGPSGFPPAIPPDATLIFEIRLMEVDDGAG